MEFSNQNGSINKNDKNSTQTAKTRTLTFASSASTQTSQTSTTAPEQKGHKLELDHERAMSMTGVKDVPTFTDKSITIHLANETLLVTGQNLAVKNLDVENGKLQVTGRVFSLKYTAQAAPSSIIKRIFK